MPAKPQNSDSSTSASASASESESATSEEEQYMAVAQAAPSSRNPGPNAKPPVPHDDDDSGSDEDENDEEEEEDEEGSDDSDSPPNPGKPAVKVEAASAVKARVVDSESEFETSETNAKPPSPLRPSREAYSASEPISCMPKDRKMTDKKPSPEMSKMPVASAAGGEKRKRPEVENGEGREAAPNGSYAKQRKMLGQPGRRTGGSAASKRLVVGGEDVERKDVVLYPSLGDALRLLEMEGGNILQKGTMIKAIQLLDPAEANALETRWKKHFAAGVRYFMERAALKEDLLKSFVGALDGK